MSSLLPSVALSPPLAISCLPGESPPLPWGVSVIPQPPQARCSVSPFLPPHNFDLGWKPVLREPSSWLELCLFSDSAFSLPHETKCSPLGETVRHSLCSPSHTCSTNSGSVQRGLLVFVELNVMKGRSIWGCRHPEGGGKVSTKEVPCGHRSLESKVCPVPQEASSWILDDSGF